MAGRSTPPCSRSTAASTSASSCARSSAAPRSSSPRRAARSTTSSAARSISQGVQIVVLDEADEMLDMGFAEDLDAILKRTPKERQTALFSATLPKRILSIAGKHLRDPVRIAIAPPRTQAGEAPRVRQVAYVVARPHKHAALGRVLDMESPTSAIINDAFFFFFVARSVTYCSCSVRADGAVHGAARLGADHVVASARRRARPCRRGRGTGAARRTPAARCTSTSARCRLVQRPVRLSVAAVLVAVRSPSITSCTSPRRATPAAVGGRRRRRRASRRARYEVGDGLEEPG